MDKEIVLETLKQYFSSEISNNMNFFKDNIVIFLQNGQKLKISAKN